MTRSSRSLEQEAARRDVTLRELVNDLLRKALATPQKSAKYRFHWTGPRGRILPGVRLDDHESLFDLMDDR